jgi:hypothetical protein
MPRTREKESKVVRPWPGTSKAYPSWLLGRIQPDAPFRAVLDSAPDAVAVIDAKRRRRVLSPANRVPSSFEARLPCHSGRARASLATQRILITHEDGIEHARASDEDAVDEAMGIDARWKFVLGGFVTCTCAPSLTSLRDHRDHLG